VPKVPVIFEEILSRAHGNFEEQNKVLQPTTTKQIIIIIIIIIMLFPLYIVIV
jgi:hypothetical protein